MDGSESSSYPIDFNGVQDKNAVVYRSTPNEAFRKLSDADAQLAIAKSEVTASDGASSSAPSEESFHHLSMHFGTEKE